MLLLFFISVQAMAQINIKSFRQNSAAINSYTEALAGKTATGEITLQYDVNSNYATGWTVRVRANGPFTRGIYSIPAEYISLKFRSATGGTTNVFGSTAPLTNVDAIILQGSAAVNSYMAQNYDMMIQGGSHLNVPVTGVYSTTLTVSVYNNSGVMVSTNTNIPISFTMNFTNKCSGIVLSAAMNNAYDFNNYEQLATGGTAIQALNVQYDTGTANCNKWSLKIRANGNFTNGSSSIAPENVSLRFNRVAQGVPTAAAIGVSSNAVQLRTTDAMLITSSNGAFDGYTHHQFDMIIQGGNYLAAAKPGIYTCPITLSLYNQDGELVSSANATLSFQFTYLNSVVNNLTVTFTDPDVNFQYNLPSDYVTGKSISKNKGLKIVTSRSYQVIVKTLTPNLTSGAHTIPASVVQLSNKPEFNLSGITSTPIELKHTDQVIIKNMMLDYNYHTTFYDLTYKISGNNNIVTSAPAGTYSNTVIFVVLPL
jgi:hypothetical protein